MVSHESTYESDVRLDTLKATIDHVDTKEGDEKPTILSVADENGRGNSLGLSEAEWTATEKSLVRKLDMTLVPMVWVLYLFNYLDRNNIAYVHFFIS